MTALTPEEIAGLTKRARTVLDDRSDWSWARQGTVRALVRDLLSTAEEAHRLRAEVERLSAIVGAVESWSHRYGASLVPPGTDTYGEGMRDAKAQVGTLLTPPAPAGPTDGGGR